MVSARITRFLLVPVVTLLTALPFATRSAAADGTSMTITNGSVISLATDGGSAAAGQGVTDHGDVFNFTATSDANGVGGSVTFTIPNTQNPASPLTVQGHVTCFRGTGTEATIGILIQDGSDASLVGNGFWLTVQNTLNLNDLDNPQTSLQLGNTDPRVWQAPEHGACVTSPKANKQVTSGSIAISIN
jgi:hypothetical protein